VLTPRRRYLGGIDKRDQLKAYHDSDRAKSLVQLEREGKAPFSISSPSLFLLLSFVL
jgi:hypothetical protein